jgi:hypothetical protein
VLSYVEQSIMTKHFAPHVEGGIGDKQCAGRFNVLAGSTCWQVCRKAKGWIEARRIETQ